MTEQQREDYYAQLFAETGECIEWTGYRNPQGYGQIGRDGKTYRLHRWAWEQANGAVPEGLEIGHRCDNKACFKLDHLEAITHAQNIQDAVSRARLVPILKPKPNPKDRAREIHALGVVSLEELARIAGVDMPTLQGWLTEGEL